MTYTIIAAMLIVLLIVIMFCGIAHAFAWADARRKRRKAAR